MGNLTELKTHYYVMPNPFFFFFFFFLRKPKMLRGYFLDYLGAYAKRNLLFFTYIYNQEPKEKFLWY